MRIECPTFKLNKTSPNQIAFLGNGWTWTYSDLNKRIISIEHVLGQQHIKQGATVSIEANNKRWKSVFPFLWASWRMGLNVLILDPSAPKPLIAECATNLESQFHVGEHCWEGIRHLPLQLLETISTQTLTDPRTELLLNSSSIAVTIATSGSSGHPKLVGLTIGNLIANASGANSVMPLQSDDCWLLSLPIHHVSGLGILWRCALAGAMVATLLSSEHWIDGILSYKPTHLSLVPTQLDDLLRNKAEIDSMKAILLGGAPTPKDLLCRAVDANLPIHLTYGSSEMGGQITTSEVVTNKNLALICGNPLPNRELSLDIDGKIKVRGACMFYGYFKEGVWILETDSDGWFYTGDKGSLLPEGLEILGRTDTMYISGGENIYPEEIEIVLRELIGAPCCVVPILDSRFGKVGVIVIEDGHKLKGIKARLCEKLPAYKVPKYWIDWPKEIPITKTKPSRYLLTQHAEVSSALHQID